MINLRRSYFTLTSPRKLLDRWLHPTLHHQNLLLNGHEMEVLWSDRFEKALNQSESGLTVEMQIYFSCMIQKRVLFHSGREESADRVNDQLFIVARTVRSTICDPVEFAAKHPVDRDLTSVAALKMHPKRVELDYIEEKWQGEFFI